MYKNLSQNENNEVLSNNSNDSIHLRNNSKLVDENNIMIYNKKIKLIDQTIKFLSLTFIIHIIRLLLLSIKNIEISYSIKIVLIISNYSWGLIIFIWKMIGIYFEFKSVQIIQNKLKKRYYILNYIIKISIYFVLTNSHQMHFIFKDILANHKNLYYYIVISIVFKYAIYINHKFSSDRSYSNSKEKNLNFWFLLKCRMENHSIIFIFKQFFADFLFFSIIIFFIEGTNPEGNKEFGFFHICMWYVIITMTTIGYGDYYVKSTISRIIIIIVSFYGIFFIGLIVIYITNLFFMNRKELTVFKLIKKNITHKEIKIYSANIIKFNILLFILITRRDPDFNKIKKILSKLKNNYALIKIYKKIYEDLKEENEIYEILDQNHYMAVRELDDLDKKIKLYKNNVK